MRRHFEVEVIDSQAFETRLGKYLATSNGTDKTVWDLIERVKSAPLLACSVIFEEDYIDRDYLDEHSAFYSKTFRKHSSRCVRLHFFSKRIENMEKMGFEIGPLAQEYLGFAVLRPTGLHPLGRTIVRPPRQDEHREFYHCQAKFETHLLGEVFSVEGMPFIQQDTQVGRCAQAALWMVARYMSRRYGYREYLPAEINTLAKKNLSMGRVFPDEWGLLPAQMLDALQGMGFAAIHYNRRVIDECAEYLDLILQHSTGEGPKPTEEEFKRLKEEVRTIKLADITYRYVESGLPVILQTDRHVVVAIGHTYDPSSKAQFAIQRIPEFLIHDDERGPYRTISLKPRKDEPSFKDVHTIFAVIPHDVTLRGEEAESMARNGVSAFLNLELKGANIPEEVLHQLRQTDPQFAAPESGAEPSVRELMMLVRPDLELSTALLSLEYRTYLMRSNEWQASLREEMRQKTLSKHVGYKFLELDYPKYVWISEVSSSSLLNHEKKGQRKCLGRVVVDSTAPAKTSGIIAIHLVDFYKFFDRQTAVSEDEPEKGLVFRPYSTPFVHRISS